MHGYAQKAKEVIGSARVLLAPLNFGAGIKGKLVDAMQCSTPSVTTDIGAEGLLPATLDENDKGDFDASNIIPMPRSDKSDITNLVNQSSDQFELWPGAINNIQSSTNAFIKSSIALYTNEKEWTLASNKSQVLYSSIFNYAQQSKQLMHCIDFITSNLTKHRQQHFIGQVMQHHTINSAKYMSQWIEAKTRLKENQYTD